MMKTLKISIARFLLVAADAMTKNKRPSEPDNKHPEQAAQSNQLSVVAPEGETSKHDSSATKQQKCRGRSRYPYRHFRFIYRVCRRSGVCPLDSNKIIACGTVLLGIVGVGGLVLTEMSLKDNRRAFDRTQRPIVSLGRKDGIVAKFAVPSEDVPNQNVGIKIYVQNGGQWPALAPRVSLTTPVIVLGPAGMVQTKAPQFPLSRNQSGFMVRSKNADGGTQETLTVGSISPQSEYAFYFPDEVSREQYDSLIWRQRVAIINGMCEYCDVLGNYTCRQFTLVYHGSPFDAFAELNEMDCALYYSYPPKASPALTYLLPCEQPAERKDREENEKKEILKNAEKLPALPPPASSPPK
jgi:hypothetical protein